uniref:Ubiquitin-conjugating enzyme E2 Q2 n=1 Tax=Aceria tosichella TaxID=561515 RepID=A0A6G1S7I5_9ACAR
MSSFTRYPFRILLVVLIVATVKAQAATNQSAKRSGSAAIASKRLMKELKAVRESDSHKNGVFTVELVDDNIYEWHVKLFKFDPESKLHKSLQQWRENGGKDHILLHVVYDADYPFSPPLVRVVNPYLKGWGTLRHGNICSELLTTRGWSSAYTIVPLILQIAATISGDEINSAINAEVDYNIEAAKVLHSTFKLIEKDHWTIGQNKES